MHSEIITKNRWLTEASLLLRLGVPIAIAHAGNAVMRMVDSAFLGHVGVSELAAAGFAGNIFGFVLVPVLALSFCFASQVSRALAVDDSGAVRRLVVAQLAIALGGVVVGIAVLVASILNFHRFGQPDLVAEMAVPYAALLLVSYAPVAVTVVFEQLWGGLSQTRMTLFSSIAGQLTNLVVDAVLIFGLFGFPRLGLIGAGIGTILGALATLATSLFLGYGSARWRHYFPGFADVSGAFVKVPHLLRLGLGSCGTIICEISAFSGTGIIMGWFGTQALAAHQIVMSCAMFTFMGALGLSQGLSVRAGEAAGRGAKSDLRLTIAVGFILVIILMGTNGLLMLMGRELIAGFFVDDAETIRIAAGIFCIAGLFQVLDGVQCLATYALRALEDIRIPLFVTTFAYWGVAIPLALLLGRVMGWGGIGVWTGLLLGLMVSAVALPLRVSRHAAVRVKPAPRAPQLTLAALKAKCSDIAANDTKNC